MASSGRCHGGRHDAPREQRSCGPYQEPRTLTSIPLSQGRHCPVSQGRLRSVWAGGSMSDLGRPRRRCVESGHTMALSAYRGRDLGFVRRGVARSRPVRACGRRGEMARSVGAHRRSGRAGHRRARFRADVASGRQRCGRRRAWPAQRVIAAGDHRRPLLIPAGVPAGSQRDTSRATACEPTSMCARSALCLCTTGTPTGIARDPR